MSDSIKRMYTSAAGYTVVELLIVITVIGIMVVPLTFITIHFFGSVTASSLQSQLALEAQNLLRTVTEELRVSSSIRSSNQLNDSNAPAGGWTTSNANLVIIISTPALDSSRQFIIDPLTGSPYQNEIVYFASGKTLYKRILANPDAPGNSWLTTCPASLASSTCPEDKRLTENFKSMNFILYDQDDIVTTDLSLAKSIVVNVSMERPTFGRTLQFDNSMRMTMRNQL